MALLKDLYNTTFYKQLSTCLAEAIPGFDKKKFLKQVDVPALESMELKARMRHTTIVLHDFLSQDYPEALTQIASLIKVLRAHDFAEHGLVFMFLPDYIECYGLNDYSKSVKALEEVTQFISCEFAVRPFLIKYGEKMVKQMEKWSKHKSFHVRRFASEGARPALPWSMAVPALKQHPEQVLPILENLKNDPHPWVRKSVANNLNDISKYNADIVLDVAGRWQGISAETDAIIKHGCRTLLKRGNAAILSHYQLDSSTLSVKDFAIVTPEVIVGNSLEFSFSVKNEHTAKQKVRLEYAVYYRMGKNQYSKKVFKISEREFGAGETAVIKRKQSFKIITTRRFYPGIHQLAIIVNGAEGQKMEFRLGM